VTPPPPQCAMLPAIASAIKYSSKIQHLNNLSLYKVENMFRTLVCFVTLAVARVTCGYGVVGGFDDVYPARKTVVRRLSLASTASDCALDPCSDETHSCSVHATCVKSYYCGSYSCSCKPGYYGDGNSCKRLVSTPYIIPTPPYTIPTRLESGESDCALSPCSDPEANSCSEHAVCEGSDYDCVSYSCTCKSGYYGDGNWCKFLGSSGLRRLQRALSQTKQGQRLI
jgi:hypothetical protein